MILLFLKMLALKFLIPFLESQSLYVAKESVEKWAHSKHLRDIGAEEPTPIVYPNAKANGSDRPGIFARWKARREARRNE